MSTTQQLDPQIQAKTQIGAGRKRRGLLLLAVIVLAVLAAGIVPRLRTRDRALDTAMAASANSTVNLVKARLATQSSTLELPGSLQPINVATIYARTNGYVRERFADIGTGVKAGQLLAIIESPEVDQELAQARGALARAKAAVEQANANLLQVHAAADQADANCGQANANERIAAITDARWTRLVDRGVLPKQDGDERRFAFNARRAETKAALAAQATSQANIHSRVADVTAGEAAVTAQVADVRRLEDLKSFERVVAPFDGVVTERGIEKGDLINAGSGGERNLFTVAQPKTLRIQVAVPQNSAVDIHTGQIAEVILRELPGETFHGKVARTAQSVVTATRTLLTEVDVDNSDGRLLPGMYAEIKFNLPRSRRVVMVPGSALIVNAQGTHVAAVGHDKRIRFLRVEAGNDLGSEVEILRGLKGGEDLVNNPPDTLSDGAEVNVFATQSGGEQ